MHKIRISNQMFQVARPISHLLEDKRALTTKKEIKKVVLAAPMIQLILVRQISRIKINLKPNLLYRHTKATTIVAQIIN
jgi:hypothetical protein